MSTSKPPILYTSLVIRNTERIFSRIYRVSLQVCCLHSRRSTSALLNAVDCRHFAEVVLNPVQVGGPKKISRTLGLIHHNWGG